LAKTTIQKTFLGVPQDSCGDGESPQKTFFTRDILLKFVRRLAPSVITTVSLPFAVFRRQIRDILRLTDGPSDGLGFPDWDRTQTSLTFGGLF
jgi:hypothetical protein